MLQRTGAQTDRVPHAQVLDLHSCGVWAVGMGTAVGAELCNDQFYRTALHMTAACLCMLLLPSRQEHRQGV